MITPKPEVMLPLVAFEPATAFHGGCLGIWEDEDFSGSDHPSEPYIVVGYDGQAWRIHEAWGPPVPPKGFFAKALTAIFDVPSFPSLVGREVTQISLSLEDFKGEICRRIPIYPNGVFDDELLVGEGLRRGDDLDGLVSSLVARVCAEVQATTSIADAMDVLLFARRDQHEWAGEFLRRPSA